ncbi:serum response factor a isoform X3 [Sinocyclocheilus anshuiensis]|uniref:serum response factor a isoform X3 n=1 Tax=Sinocyclocheilus anshuiensis TaxID=1608454 RepID=UPI0007B7B444|nr:PREDICTED: serum response factor-like isoform X3 [Sinocyclocheilus anshuiensis]
MLGGNGTARGAGRSGNGAGLTPLQVGSTSGALGAVNSAINLPDGGRYDDGPSVEAVLSGSDGDSDSGDDEESPAVDRRGVKRERSEMEVGGSSGTGAGLSAGYGGVSSGVAGAKPGKKTRGRVKIKMEFIDNKLRRYTTFSKRKTGIMKKAYELSTLTGTQVLLLVASETGHVYTFATRKLQPMITSETGKALIQTCLNSPDSPPRTDPSTDQRMSATGFEETDLTYQVSEADGLTEPKEMIKPMFTAATLPGGTNSTTTQSSASSSPSSSSVSMHTQSSALSLSSTTCWPLAAGMNAQSVSSVNGTVLKSSPAGVMQLPSGFTLMPASHTATIVTSSVPSSVAGHMMYPGAHVMYATSTPTLADGSLTVLNTFPQPPTAMHVSHTPAQDSGAVPQMFLTGPPGTVQIPVSAVPLHSMLINQQATGSSSSTLTELRVVNLDNPKAD